MSKDTKANVGAVRAGETRKGGSKPPSPPPSQTTPKGPKSK